jgi:hypothetical protein
VPSTILGSYPFPGRTRLPAGARSANVTPRPSQTAGSRSTSSFQFSMDGFPHVDGGSKASPRRLTEHHGWWAEEADHTTQPRYGSSGAASDALIALSTAASKIGRAR